MNAKRILVVDDDEACCELLKDYFMERNYIVDIVWDGVKAKGLLDKNQYEYIIFDYNMPVFSGVSLAKVMKEKNIQAKKILISGYDLVDDEIVKSLGVDTFLRKPFLLEDLAAIIKD